MRGRLSMLMIVLAACASALLLPWLAWREAQHQAYDLASEMALGHARDVLYRADETSRQADAAVRRLSSLPGTPCSAPALELMRRLDLTSTYIQAIGFASGDSILCSSMGSAPIALGRAAFRSANGVSIYLEVPVEDAGRAPLMALERGHYAVLVHRDLPLDTRIPVSGAALGILHLDSGPGSGPTLAKGTVRREWLAMLGARQEASFTDGAQLVAAVRSPMFRIVAVAAVPTAYVDERAAGIARRLLPASVLAGLAVAAGILSLARKQRSIKAAIRDGLRRKEFYLRYQPIVELASGRVVGVEALLRWQRATGETLGPDLFIPVAEQSGLITRLTARVFELAEADSGAYLANNPDFHVAINVSPSDLTSSSVVELVDRFLARTGAKPSNLIIEITERGVLDLDNARRVIAALRTRGVMVAIDDFGTGYSSLSYLEALELDFLKIDRSFIEAIGTDAPTSQVVGHIIEIAGTLGLRTIAEGIEREAQAAFLRERAVQYAQGWLFGKPMSFTAAVELGRSGRINTNGQRNAA